MAYRIPERAGGADFPWLLEAARSGARPELGYLLESLRPALAAAARRMAARLGRGRLDPDDVVQETLTAAVRDIAAFRGQTAPELLCWLRRILFCKVCDERRRPHGSRPEEVSVSREMLAKLTLVPDEAGTELERGDCCSAVRRALELLPAGQRNILIARFWEGRAFAAIAAGTGRSEPALRQACARALRALRKHLEKIFLATVTFASFLRLNI
jgi:RNA polymerase sigma-70 factor, ECF subfamily